MADDSELKRYLRFIRRRWRRSRVRPVMLVAAAVAGLGHVYLLYVRPLLDAAVDSTALWVSLATVAALLLPEVATIIPVRLPVGGGSAAVPELPGSPAQGAMAGGSNLLRDADDESKLGQQANDEAEEHDRG